MSKKNVDEKYIYDEDGTAYRNMREMFLTGKLNLCGCVNEEILIDVVNILKEFIKNSKDTSYHVYYTNIAERLDLDEKYVELILCYLDDKGLLEHGTAIRGSWLSEEGIKIVKKFKKVFR